jgi:hypothetical protein
LLETKNPQNFVLFYQEISVLHGADNGGQIGNKYYLNYDRFVQHCLSNVNKLYPFRAYNLMSNANGH